MFPIANLYRNLGEMAHAHADYLEAQADFFQHNQTLWHDWFSWQRQTYQSFFDMMQKTTDAAREQAEQTQQRQRQQQQHPHHQAA
jgi:hypothetical protein